MKIYLVVEVGTGTIHYAFKYEEAAQAEVKTLEEQTGMNCYEILAVNYYDCKD